MRSICCVLSIHYAVVINGAGQGKMNDRLARIRSSRCQVERKKERVRE